MFSDRKAQLNPCKRDVGMSPRPYPLPYLDHRRRWHASPSGRPGRGTVGYTRHSKKTRKENPCEGAREHYTQSLSAVVSTAAMPSLSFPFRLFTCQPALAYCEQAVRCSRQQDVASVAEGGGRAANAAPGHTCTCGPRTRSSRQPLRCCCGCLDSVRQPYAAPALPVVAPARHLRRRRGPAAVRHIRCT